MPFNGKKIQTKKNGNAFEAGNYMKPKVILQGFKKNNRRQALMIERLLKSRIPDLTVEILDEISQPNKLNEKRCLTITEEEFEEKREQKREYYKYQEVNLGYSSHKNK